jgi:hypothetical protein
MTTPVQGQQFEPEEEKLLEGMAEHWRKVWNEAPVLTLPHIEDAAKQVIVVTTGLQGLYVAIFIFSNIRSQVMMSPGGVLGVLILLLFFTPLVCWLVSLFCATHVFMPRVRPDINFNEVSSSAWQKIKDAYGRANMEKLRWLRRSHKWLVVSFALVLITIVVLIFLPTVPATPTPIIIITPTP